MTRRFNQLRWSRIPYKMRRCSRQPTYAWLEHRNYYSSLKKICISKQTSLLPRGTRSSVSHLWRSVTRQWCLYGVTDIHSCATVFLISLLCSPKHIRCMDEASLLEGLSRCFAALKRYQSRSRAAGRCRKFLISVQQEVFCHRSQNGLSPSIYNY